jgi:hypothetical protein
MPAAGSRLMAGDVASVLRGWAWPNLSENKMIPAAKAVTTTIQVIIMVMAAIFIIFELSLNSFQRRMIIKTSIGGIQSIFIQLAEYSIDEPYRSVIGQKEEFFYAEIIIWQADQLCLKTYEYVRQMSYSGRYSPERGRQGRENT